ncbi:NnrS family protein [Herbaspirillum sp. RV1423]|uniref:NnrS family protein n=1 Tax=Herbaspirillum sp. RV1423 TaxID=1443993 RepID=UPI0009DEE22F|nr:NnrS family protein [Herbaspirillum sp. RV1423]
MHPKNDRPAISPLRALLPEEHALWRLGFRPFYLFGATFAAVSIPLWIAQYLGWAPGLENVNLLWHMHEMVFGFAVAIVIGFLYTAARNWTGLWTPRSGHLAALLLLWLAGRGAMLFAPPLWAAVIDLAFLPFAAWPIYRILRSSGNKRNYFLVGLLGLLTLTNVMFHAAVNGWPLFSPVTAVYAAILIIVIIESVIAARVIPMFTKNGAPGVTPVVRPRLDKICLALIVAASISYLSGLPAVLVSSLALAASAAQLWRLYGWQSHRTAAYPLLWILHVSYAWIPLGFILIALSAFQLVPASAAFHALTVGSMAGLIIGMMTRTSLGHTGRMLTSGWSELVMYLSIQAGAVLRVAAALGPPIGMRDDVRAGMLASAALCWSVAFLLFIAVYGRYLLRPRLDGREG